MKNDTFEYSLKIHEGHLDSFGHVNNAKYLELYEEARWDFITKNGYGLKEIRDRKIGPVILNANISFKRELINREDIVIESVSGEMKNSLVMYLHQKMIKSCGTVASEVIFEVGLFDLQERKLIIPTKEWMKAIGVN